MSFFWNAIIRHVDELDRVYRRLGDEPLDKESLRAKLRMESDRFDKVLEKLVIHGGGAVDFDENAVRGAQAWRDSYAAESQRRKAQLDQALQYAVSSQCRMTSLIRHFGDLADAQRPCGHCDVCAPDACVARRFRAPSESEKQTAWAVIHALKKTSAGSTGKLHKDMFPREQVSRDDFENLLQAMAAAGLVRLEELSFEKDGRNIAYRKASLTQEGEELPSTDPLEFILPDNADHASPARRKSDRKRSGKIVPSKTATTSARRTSDTKRNVGACRGHRGQAAHLAARRSKETWRPSLLHSRQQNYASHRAGTAPHAGRVALRQRNWSLQGGEIRR